MPPQPNPSPPLPVIQDDASTEAKTAATTKNHRLIAWKQRKRKRTIDVKIQTEYDVVFEILSRLPAQVLHRVIRHVCKEWCLMIRTQSFIHHHIWNSSSGLMIQEKRFARNAIYVEMQRGHLEICNCEIGDRVWTSCNGLVLAPDFRDPKMIAVINPLTKERTVLPPFSVRTKGYSKFCLAFVEASMEYKVVRKPFGSKPEIVVLTVGVDKVWRHVDMELLSLTTWEALPLVTGGYMHWIDAAFVLTLNLETETIRSFPMPRLQKGGKQFLPMGSNLSIVYKARKFWRDILEMNPETGEWTMLLRFDFKPLISRFKAFFRGYLGLFRRDLGSIIPVGWLVVREVLLFSTSKIQRHCVAYNVKTREIQSFKLNRKGKRCHFQAHVNSLAWLEGYVDR